MVMIMIMMITIIIITIICLFLFVSLSLNRVQTEIRNAVKIGPKLKFIVAKKRSITFLSRQDKRLLPEI
jgi:hypothetical protein